MTILDQAEQLRQEAISLLLQERGTIEKKLTQLGYTGETGKQKAASQRVAVDVVKRVTP